MPAPRKWKFNRRVADLILQRVAEGDTLAVICTQTNFPPYWAVLQWRREVPEFATELDAAKLERAELWAEEVLNIADTVQEGEKITNKVTATGTETSSTTYDMLEHRRLRVNTRLWMLERLIPKKYSLHGREDSDEPKGVMKVLIVNDPDDPREN